MSSRKSWCIPLGTTCSARLSYLYNLVVDLDEEFDLTPQAWSALKRSVPGVTIADGGAADDTTLAWIDATFGGWWSSEAFAGKNAIATRDGLPIGFATFDSQHLRFAWLRGVARESEVGIFGPFGVAPERRGTGIGRVLLRLALCGLRASGYRRALIGAVGERLIPFYAAAVGARVAQRFARAALLQPPPRTVVLASGSGSNFAAVADRVAAGTLPIHLTGVVSNDPQAGVLAHATAAGVAATVLPWVRRAQSRAEYDACLLDAVAAMEPDLVLLLGWMHLLDERFVNAFASVLNVHPAFLPLDPRRDDVALPDATQMPAFRGRYAVRDALAYGAGWIGATVHAVTALTDRGPVLTRRPLALQRDDDQARVMARLHPVEHELVAAAVMRWLYERP